MTALADAISRALIHFLWQGSIVAVSLWLILIALRKRSANARYIASCAALLAMAAMAMVTASILYSAEISPKTGAAAVAHAVQGVSMATAAFRAQQPIWLAWLQAWALPAWSLGVLLCSTRLILGYNHAFKLGRRGKPAGDSIVEVVGRLRRLMGVAGPVRVLISPIVETPSVVGWLRPVVLLPAATLMGLTPLQLEAIVAHEIGHIKRYDYLVNMMQMLVETMLFYHPAVWWTSRRIRLERELCCDDLAVRFSGNALRYARALTTLEKLRLRTPSTAMASTGGPLMYRIQRLAGVNPKDCGPSRLPALLAVGLGVFCLVLNVSWVRGQDAPGVKVELGSSSVIHRTAVPYPEAAQKQNITGTVQVEVKLDSTGNVADAHILSGPEELRKAALESVLDWHFTHDAARGTRLITISFSEQGKQVQVREPGGLFAGEVGGVAVNGVAVNDDGWKRVAEVKKMIEGQAAESERRAQDRAQEQSLVLAQRKQWESELVAIQLKLKAVANVPPEARVEAELRANQIRKELEAAPFSGRRSPIPGRVLKGVSTMFLPDAVRSDLLSRLPVREGDVLTQQSIEQTGVAVRSYDEHLRIQFLSTDDGQAELRISAPSDRDGRR